jgi:hypothetical protein
MPRKFPKYSGTVEYKSDGVTYSGTYYVQDGIVTLVCSFGSKKAVQGGLTADALARLLFGELIRESRANRI